MVGGRAVISLAARLGNHVWPPPAAGAAGSVCPVVPSRDAVLVRMGHTVGAARDHADAYYDAVFGAILAALGGA